MKTLAGCMVAVGLLSSHVAGGTVSFVPNNVGVLPFDPGSIGAIDIDLWITDFDGALGTEGDVGESFDGLDLLVGASDGLQITGFVFNSETVNPVAACHLIPDNCVARPGPGDLYPNEFKVGVFALLAPAVLGDDGFLLGTLTVDASGIGIGTYNLTIDGDFDGLQSSAASGSPLEAMFGRASIITIPEPATLTLLGLASAALLRRRAAT